MKLQAAADAVARVVARVDALSHSREERKFSEYGPLAEPAQRAHKVIRENGGRGAAEDHFEATLAAIRHPEAKTRIHTLKALPHADEKSGRDPRHAANEFMRHAQSYFKHDAEAVEDDADDTATVRRKQDEQHAALARHGWRGPRRMTYVHDDHDGHAVRLNTAHGAPWEHRDGSRRVAQGLGAASLAWHLRGFHGDR